MRIEGFTATADVVGRRVNVAWTVVPEEGDPVGEPRVVLRRKARDFEFPPVAGDDPFAVYDSAAFPPPGRRATEVDLGLTAAPDGGRTSAIAVTVAGEVEIGLRTEPIEIARRTRRTTVSPAGTVLARHEDVLDVGGDGTGLHPGRACYYQLLVDGDPGGRRAVATPTELHLSARTLYEQLPAVVRRHDVTVPPPRDTGAIPEATPLNGQLRRFLDLVGAGVDHLRSRADGLADVHDVDEVDHRLLPHLAATIGWELDTGQPVPLQRHEIRYATQLYGLTGTVPGTLAWIKRLSGWDARLAEFWRNVFVTNDLGNPDDPDDRGSRTVDTSALAAMTAIGTADDVLDYTYDTGTGPDDWYAPNVVGAFVTPADDEPLDAVVARRGRVLASVERFLPCNLRLVVVVDAEPEVRTTEPTLGFTTTDDTEGPT